MPPLLTLTESTFMDSAVSMFILRRFSVMNSVTVSNSLPVYPFWSADIIIFRDCSVEMNGFIAMTRTPISKLAPSWKPPPRGVP